MFGPVVLFGAGGVAVELLQDTAIELPPLDSGLAAALVARTRAGAQLAGFRGRPPADLAAVCGALIALSHLAEDFPCVRSVDVNPLLADADGVLALDAQHRDRARRHRPAGAEPGPGDPALSGGLAAQPRPRRRRPSRSGRSGRRTPTSTVRFLAHTDPEDLRCRFLAPRRNFPDEMGLRLTQLDYDREMAFVALTPEGELAGVARLACDPDHVERRVCDDRAVGPEGQGHRRGADADADRLCHRRRARAGSRAWCSPRTGRCSASCAASASAPRPTRTTRRWC